jgi:branched-chain amino acid transport system substrate-binding protein
VTQYRHLLRQKDPSAVPDFVEFEGYIVARAIVRALEMGGRELDRNRFSAALRAIQFDGPKTYRLKFGPADHVATRYVDLVMLAEGGRIAD